MMRNQKVISHMKGQDKTPEKQLNEVEIGKLPEKKRVQKNDSEDDPGSQENNGEDARKGYQTPRRIELTNRDV